MRSVRHDEGCQVPAPSSGRAIGRYNLRGVPAGLGRLWYNRGMSHHTLLEYIRRAKDCGADDAQITSRLKTAGWYSVDIEDGLELYHKLTRSAEPKCEPMPAAPKPSLSERIVPRTYDPYIIPIAVLTFVIVFVLYMIFR